MFFLFVYQITYMTKQLINPSSLTPLIPYKPNYSLIPLRRTMVIILKHAKELAFRFLASVIWNPLLVETSLMLLNIIE